MRDFNDFVRACYLNSEPSVDLTATEEQVDCCHHKLALSVYKKLVDELKSALCGKVNEQDVDLACNMWALQSGPQLVEG